MSPFPGSDSLVIRMVFLPFIILFFFLQVPAMMAGAGKELLNPLAELSSREELANIAGYGEEKLSTVTISGKVLCHACMDGKAPIPTYPVSGASVAVFCGSSGKLRKSWARGRTDVFGEFFIDLPSHLHAIPNLEQVCLVKVLHLPKDSPCGPAFTGKHAGIKLVAIEDGARGYTANKILLMPKSSEARKRTRPN